MRILVLSKRQYMGKDLLDERYGRFFEIPAALSRLGHQVQGVALSYSPRAEGTYRWDDTPGLCWQSINLGRTVVPSLRRYAAYLREGCSAFRPDIAWVCSDSFHAIGAPLLHSRFDLHFVTDLYDNFEGYPAARIPGLPAALRSACRQANGLTVVSDSLASHMAGEYRITAPVQVLGNAVRDDLFRPGDSITARVRLGLPGDGRLIGTAGKIDERRGIGDLVRAFRQLASRDSRLHLVVAGPRGNIPPDLDHERIIDLGILPLEQVPEFLRALDVGVICNRDSAFGRFCFPQKFFEMVACGTPVVVAAVGDIAQLLQKFPACLYRPGAPAELAEAITCQLERPVPLQELKIPTWEDRALELLTFFNRVAPGERTDSLSSEQA